jgi:hypothetical protein
VATGDRTGHTSERSNQSLVPLNLVRVETLAKRGSTLQGRLNLLGSEHSTVTSDGSQTGPRDDCVICTPDKHATTPLLDGEEVDLMFPSSGAKLRTRTA